MLLLLLMISLPHLFVYSWMDTYHRCVLAAVADAQQQPHALSRLAACKKPGANDDGHHMCFTNAPCTWRSWRPAGGAPPLTGRPTVQCPSRPDTRRMWAGTLAAAGGAEWSSCCGRQHRSRGRKGVNRGEGGVPESGGMSRFCASLKPLQSCCVAGCSCCAGAAALFSHSWGQVKKQQHQWSLVVHCAAPLPMAPPSSGVTTAALGLSALRDQLQRPHLISPHLTTPPQAPATALTRQLQRSCVHRCARLRPSQ